MPRTNPTLADRLWSRVQATPQGCWEYTGHRQKAGYGRIQDRGVKLTHRVAYELTYGDIPEGMVVRHRCDNPPCINPGHLELGTHGDNARDRAARGRGARGERSGPAKLTDGQVAEIRAARLAGMTQQAIADQYGIHQTQVSRIVRNQLWKVSA